MAGYTNTHQHILFYIFVFLIVVGFCGYGVHAFGAGNIPNYAYIEGKAFRHGDIEDVLADLVKKGAAGLLSRGTKFGGLDIKRVYFGNWLRDYSQAVDIAALKKIPLQTILNLVTVLGFLAHGYATSEFEVTEGRLGVYLPVEHIDNPKGYGEGENPKTYDQRLRGPVDPQELWIDPRTGMKNYIANENGTWDTSKAHVRRVLERCIQLGRQYRANNRKEDQFEAFRLLGTALHTLEDFTAHSNFCELALVSMGHGHVFTHVGDRCKIRSPHGKDVSPLVTGTFGGSDFIHSLLGEATDHISSASVSDLNKEIDRVKTKAAGTRGGPGSDANTLRDLLFQIPGGAGNNMSRDIDSLERIRANGQGQGGAGGKKPEDMSPQELHATLWQILKFRDDVMKNIEMTIEKIPGLSALVERIVDSIAVFIITTLEPYVKPILQQATGTLQTSSAEVINSHDQFEVFNNLDASDPTHSFLSKDHFGLILNEPAGNIAKIIVTHTVKLVIQAWDNSSINPMQVAEEATQCLFHPDFHNPQFKVQTEMLQFMRTWIEGLGAQKHDILNRLSKESVRNHKNVRPGMPEESGHVHGGAYNAGVQAQHDLQGYLASHIPGGGAFPQVGGHGGPAPGGFGAPSFGMPGHGGGGYGGFPGRDGPHYDHGPGGYAPPPGPPPGGYAPPSGPPPGPGSQASSFYGGGGGTYGAPSSGAPTFPGAAGSSPWGAPSHQSNFTGSAGGGFPAPPNPSQKIVYSSDSEDDRKYTGMSKEEKERKKAEKKAAKKAKKEAKKAGNRELDHGSGSSAPPPTHGPGHSPSPSSYNPPPGPPPSFPGGPGGFGGGYGPPPGPPPHFPGATSSGFPAPPGPGGPPSFPGAPGFPGEFGAPQFPGANPSGYNQPGYGGGFQQPPHGGSGW